MGFAAVVGAVIGVASLAQQRKAQKAAEKAAKQKAANQQGVVEVKKQQNDVSARQDRIKQAREARIRRARIIAATGNEGLGFNGTSGSVGGTSSVSSQAANNIGNINQDVGFANRISVFNQGAADAQGSYNSAQASNAQWQSIGNVGSSIFEAGGGWQTIFGGNTHKAAGT